MREPTVVDDEPVDHMEQPEQHDAADVDWGQPS